MKSRLLALSVPLFLTTASVAETYDPPTVIAFTRHTFRGASKLIPAVVPQVSNLKLKSPILAYGQDTTVAGLAISKKFGQTAYNDGAALALKTIDADASLAGNWSSIRPDLATQRTFWTAIKLQQGLTLANGKNIPLLACPTEPGVAIDVVPAFTNTQEACIDSNAMQIAKKTIKNEMGSTYVVLANKLIALLQGEPNVSNDDPYHSFSDVKLLSSMIEFSSDFKDSSVDNLLQDPIHLTPAKEHEVVSTAMKILGISTLLRTQGLKSDASTLAKVNYISKLKAGTQQIILSHDGDLSELLQGLEIISAQSSPFDLAVYPLDTITIAINSKKVSIVRTRINMNKNGSMTGNAGFTSKVLWSGDRKAWEKKIENIKIRIGHYPDISGCLQKIDICKTSVLPVMLSN